MTEPPKLPPSAAPPPRWWAGYLGLTSLALGLLLAVGTVVAALRSERYGVTMAFVTAGPLVFGFVGTAVAVLTRRARSVAVAVAVPLGCGCASAVIALVLAAFFFGFIWPRL